MKIANKKVMTLTEAAASRVRQIMAEAETSVVGLRVGVRNGGCAGMSYTMELAEQIAPYDTRVEDKGVTLLIDAKAVLFLLGAEMDFKADRLGASFTFRNPNETGACGCGESVALTPVDPSRLEMVAETG